MKDEKLQPWEWKHRTLLSTFHTTQYYNRDYHNVIFTLNLTLSKNWSANIFRIIWAAHYSSKCTMFWLTYLSQPTDILNNSPRHSPYMSCWHSPKRWHCASSWIPRARRTPTEIDSFEVDHLWWCQFWTDVESPTLINHTAKFFSSHFTIFHWRQHKKKMSDVCRHVASELWLVFLCGCRLSFEKLNENSKVVSACEFKGAHTL